MKQTIRKLVACRGLPTRSLQAQLRQLCAHLGVSDCWVGVVLINQAYMQHLNAQYAGNDYPTDVLSFAVHPRQHPQTFLRTLQSLAKQGVPPVLGDVYICAPILQAYAQESGLTHAQMFLKLMIHGVLHLCGYDHVHGGRQKKMMQQQEARLWRALTQTGGDA